MAGSPCPKRLSPIHTLFDMEKIGNRALKITQEGRRGRSLPLGRTSPLAVQSIARSEQIL